MTASQPVLSASREERVAMEQLNGPERQAGGDLYDGNSLFTIDASWARPSAGLEPRVPKSSSSLTGLGQGTLGLGQTASSLDASSLGSSPDSNRSRSDSQHSAEETVSRGACAIL